MSPLDVSAFIWDLDDTLISTKKRIHRAQTKALALVVPEQQLEHASHIWTHLYWYLGMEDATQIIRIVIAELGLPARPAHIIAESAALAQEDSLAGPYELLPGAGECLAWLRSAGFRQGIVTNGDRRLQEQKFEQSEVSKWIDQQFLLVATRESGQIKPNPELLIECASLMGVSPAKTAYVGNRITDVMAANLAGTVSILIPTGNYEYKEPSYLAPTLRIESADLLFDNCSDLAVWLQAADEGTPFE